MPLVDPVTAPAPPEVVAPPALTLAVVGDDSPDAPPPCDLTSMLLDDPSPEELLRRAADAEPDVRQRVLQHVISTNLDLPKRLAGRYRGKGEPEEDLEQVANMGLVLAVLRFNPDHGVSLQDFATPTITGELRKHFRDRCWTVRPPRRLQELRPELRQAQVDLEQSLHRVPTAVEVADAMGLTLAEVAEIENAATGYSPVSLEHPTGADGMGSTLGDSIADDIDDIDHLLTQMAVHSLLDCLTPRQRRIIELRFFSEMTQQQIADDIGVSQVQVSRLLTQILARLRSMIDDDTQIGRTA